MPYKKKTYHWESKVESILHNAFGDNRSMLFEHEVYEILGYLGITVPKHIIVRNEKDITNHTLSLFGSDKVVLKIISRDIAHKEKAGGVSIVYKDPDFVRYCCTRMISTFKDRNYLVDGILMMEYIPYSKELGDEILLGFRESDAFGPVISFSKGGSDAVHFATYFSSPNLILPPLDKEWASALLSSTKIQVKYIQQGKTNYSATIVDTAIKFSDLAIAFSHFFDSASGYVWKELEINPFVFDSEGYFIALDGYASFTRRRPDTGPATVRPKQTLRPFFEPRGIAVIGVSERDNTKPSTIILKNLIELGRDDIYCVNKKGGKVVIAQREYTLYRSVVDIPDAVDLAVISIPAEATLPVVSECGKKGIKAIVLISGGFSEVTKNKELEEGILSIARAHSMRIIGPNCLGILYAGDSEGKGVNTFFIPENKFKVNLEREKNVALLTQSGAMGIMELYNLRNAISPKVVVSYGNQLDVDPTDLVHYFDADPVVQVIGLYIEGFKSGAGRSFFDIVAGSKKPIIVYKAGRTEAGMLAAQSHTASIAGEYEIAKAAMKQAGLIVADTMMDHGDLVKIFALLSEFSVQGNRVAVIANAGYEKTAAADSLGNLILAELRDETKQKLARVLPPFVGIETLLDLTPMISDEQFTECIKIFLEAPEIDALCISIVPHAQVIHTTDQEIEQYKQNIAARIVELVHAHKKPVVVSVNVVSGTDAVYNKFGQVLDSGGVPTYLTAQRAMACLNEFVRYKLIKEKHVISEWLRE